MAELGSSRVLSRPLPEPPRSDDSLLIFSEVPYQQHKLQKAMFLALGTAVGMSMVSTWHLGEKHDDGKPITAIHETNTLLLLISSALVMLMTPSLSLYYGGLVHDHAVLNRMVRTFVCLGIVGVQWITIGYSLAFAPSNPNSFDLIGDFSFVALREVTTTTKDLPPLAKDADVPHLAYMGYQLMFASITTTILSGAIAEYMSFRAFCLFILLWTTCVYDPVCHAIWGGGVMSWHLDFAGGTVVHLLSGLSATVAATYLNHIAKDDATIREATLTVEALDPAQPTAVYERRRVERRASFDKTLAKVHAGTAKEYHCHWDHALGSGDSAHSPTFVVLGATCMPDIEPRPVRSL